AGHDRRTHFLGAGTLLLLEVLTPGNDDVLAAVLVFDHTELVDLSFMYRRVLGANDVDLREGTKCTLACEAHFVPAFHRFRHLAFPGDPGPERVLELPLGRGVAHAPARKHDAAPRGNDHRVDAI